MLTVILLIALALCTAALVYQHRVISASSTPIIIQWVADPKIHRGACCETLHDTFFALLHEHAGDDMAKAEEFIRTLARSCTTPEQLSSLVHHLLVASLLEDDLCWYELAVKVFPNHPDLAALSTLNSEIMDQVLWFGDKFVLAEQLLELADDHPANICHARYLIGVATRVGTAPSLGRLAVLIRQRYPSLA